MPAQLHILILEDQPMYNDILSLRLLEDNVEAAVTQVDNREAFLKALNSSEFDAVISDYVLPDINGKEAVALVKQICPETPLIIFTGSVDEETAVECMKLGAADYVLKQQPTRLVPALLSAVEHMRRKKALEESQARVKQSLEWQEAVFEGSRDAVFISDGESRFVFVNEAACKLTGFTRPELLTMRIPDLHEKPDQKAYYDSHERIMQGEETLSEAKIHRKDGSKVDTEFNNTRIIISGTAYMHTTARDITDRKRAQEELYASEDQFRRLSEAAFEAIAIHDGGILLSANDQYFKMFRYEPEELLGKQVMALTVAPEAKESMTKQLTTGGLGPYESIGLRKDGTTFPMEIRVRQMEYNGRNVRVGAILDISDRRRTEEEIKRKTEDLSLLSELNAAANRGESVQKIIFLLAEQTKRIFSSTGATVYLPSEDKQYLIMQNLSIPQQQVQWIEKLIRMKIPEVRIPLNGNSLYHRIWREGKPHLANDPETIRQLMAELTQNKTLKKLVPAILNFLGIRSVITAPLITGDELIGMMDISRESPFTESDLKRTAIIAEEISAIFRNKTSEEELRSSDAQLHALAEHLLSVREEERANLARELHDNLGQLLTGLKMQLSFLGETPTDRDSLRVVNLRKAKIEFMDSLIDKAVAVARGISLELRPAILDSLGLSAALEWLANDFQQKSGIVCTCLIKTNIVVDAKSSTAMFRITQEALTNVVRHSKASESVITLKREPNEVILSVRDNGVGIKDEEIADMRSVGLLGIKERAAAIGGTIEISSKAGKGTTLLLRIPLRDNKDVSTTSSKT